MRRMIPKVVPVESTTSIHWYRTRLMFLPESSRQEIPTSLRTQTIGIVSHDIRNFIGCNAVVVVDCEIESRNSSIIALKFLCNLLGLYVKMDLHSF